MTATAEKVETTLKFETKKFALHALLDRAASVVPDKDILPVLKNFLLDVSGDRITVAATDMELAVIATSKMVNVAQPGTAVFPAKRLLDIVREADDGDLILEVTNSTAKIKVGRTTWSLKLQSGDDYPALPDGSELQFQSFDRAKFLAGVASVRLAAATEVTRQNLMMIDISQSKMRAADGVRFQQVELDFPVDIQVPIRAVDDLVKILRMADVAQVEVAEAEDYLCFKVVDQIFVANKLTAEFPDVDEILLKPALTNEQELHVDRDEFIRAIKKARITANPDTSAVVLTLYTAGKMEVSSKDKGGSWTHVELDVSWKGPDEKQVGFNHAHLLDMLKMTDAQSCSFFLGDGKKSRPAPLLFRDDEKGVTGVLNQLLVEFL